MKSICIFWEVYIYLNKHALLDIYASYLYILVGHKVMVGLYIFVGDNTIRQLLSNRSTSRLQNESKINYLSGEQINCTFIEGNRIKACVLSFRDDNPT